MELSSSSSAAPALPGAASRAAAKRQGSVFRIHRHGREDSPMCGERKPRYAGFTAHDYGSTLSPSVAKVMSPLKLSDMDFRTLSLFSSMVGLR